MRLYLSSFRLGPHHRRLLSLLGDGRRTALVTNALDDVPRAGLGARIERDLTELTACGLAVTTVDLREPGAVDSLSTFDLIWVRGGNVFVLRRALADSGADEVLTDLLRRDAVVYGGYSAGPCVLGPDLSPLQQVDDLHAVAVPLTTGLGVLDRPFVPHVRSPGHPETAACTKIAEDYRDQERPCWALGDGQVLVVDGHQVEVV